MGIITVQRKGVALGTAAGFISAAQAAGSIPHQRTRDDLRKYFKGFAHRKESAPFNLVRVSPRYELGFSDLPTTVDIKSKAEGRSLECCSLRDCAALFLQILRGGEGQPPMMGDLFMIVKGVVSPGSGRLLTVNIRCDGDQHVFRTFWDRLNDYHWAGDSCWGFSLPKLPPQ